MPTLLLTLYFHSKDEATMGAFVCNKVHAD